MVTTEDKLNNEVNQTKMQLPTTSSTASTASAASAGNTASPATTSSGGPSNGTYRQRSSHRSNKTGLPPSAASAAPYVPPAYQQPLNPEFVHQHHHVTYGYEAPPPPMGQPPPTWVTPYYFDGGPGGGAHPPPTAAAPGGHHHPHYMQHMCTMPPPPPTTVSSNSKGGGGRVTPSSSTNVTSATSEQPPPPAGPPQNFEVEYHLHSGEVISLQLGDGRVEIIPGKRLSAIYVLAFVFCNVLHSKVYVRLLLRPLRVFCKKIGDTTCFVVLVC